MLQTVHSSEFPRTMDLFNEIDDLSDLFFLEKSTKLDTAEGGFEDLQSKYSNLHETYSKEIEKSKKVEKCLIKCLKFYSKLCKKYEVQQKIISDLEERIKEKVRCLGEAQQNEEKMKGLIEVYRTERTLYAGQSTAQLRKEKEILLDICCKVISESGRNNSINNLSSLLLRKFKKDLDDEKIILLKSKSIKLKDELDFCTPEDSKLDLGTLKNEGLCKFEEKYSNKMTKVETKDPDEDDKKNQLDLRVTEVMLEQSSSLENRNSDEGSSEIPSGKTERDEEGGGIAYSLPSLVDFPAPLELPRSDDELPRETDGDGGNPGERVLGQDEVRSDEMRAGNECWSDGQAGNPERAETLTSLENDFFPLGGLEPDVVLTLPANGGGSIFDVSDVGPKRGDGGRKGEDGEERWEDLSFAKDANKFELGNLAFPGEVELLNIFKEMTSVRLLSPIRDCSSGSTNDERHSEDGRSGGGLKRASSGAEQVGLKSKKLKTEEEQSRGCLLDSIMSAMSIQNEEFKSKRFERKEPRESEEVGDGSSGESWGPGGRTRRRGRGGRPGAEGGRNPSSSESRSKGEEQAAEKMVADEIRNFVSTGISSKEEADKNVRRCISALADKSEEAIAKCVVATVFENIDEPVETFERPAPPLTKTQHRLIVLLSVFRTLDWNSEKISGRILSLISEKLFPDNFFWPDDCVEAAARFFAALCRARNEPKTLWKFCLTAMTDMRQRCPLLVFTVLKTWPDVLHDASTLKNNLLAVTIVNIFLHMPKTEGLRNLNQRRKLVALRHLLINFYQFKTEDTIERFAGKVLAAVRRGEPGSEKSVVLLSRCRDAGWTLKNVVTGLMTDLAEWAGGKVGDSVGNAVLSVMKQICPILLREESAEEGVKDVARCLLEILTSGKKNHDSEVNLVEVLLLLKQYPEVRKVIREWVPKHPISEGLRNEIINVSAENILRELKLNRRKEGKHFTVKKRQWKKTKGKKKKGKKRKKNEQKPKAGSKSS